MGDDLVAGYRALGCGDWELARVNLVRAVESGGGPRAWEGLAEAARWLGDIRVTFAARERACQLYREAGDDAAAARMATWLAYDSLTMRGDRAVAAGWFAWAHRLLESHPGSPERGWLAYREGESAIVADSDPTRAIELGEFAAEVAGGHGLSDLRLVALALRGLAEVAQGDVAGGMRCLDEAAAAALAGEVSAFHVAGTIYCHLVRACEWTRDLSRAAQWCDVALDLAGRWRADQLFGICAHYAGVLIWRGRWEQAEQQLAVALRCLAAGAPALGLEAAIRLAWLRCRQGRFNEAIELCDGLEWHPLAQLCLIEVALESGDLDHAGDLVDRHLRGLAPADRLLRAPGLELAVRVASARGDLHGARESLAVLEPIAAAVGTGSLRASQRFCSALVDARCGDLTAARTDLTDAADLWTREGALYETAVVRRELGAVLLGLGRPAAAAREWHAAQRAFAGLGAIQAAESVENLLNAQDATAPTRLSDREVQVLRLVADGLSDREISARLAISPHTVHRHVANIRTKLDQPSRAAAVAHATRIQLI